jgi:protein-tyrosine phosphatase family protein
LLSEVNIAPSTLVQKDFPADYKPFLAQSGIKHYVFDMEGTKKQAIPIQTMNIILRLALDRRNYPLLIHCNHGRVSWNLPPHAVTAPKGALLTHIASIGLVA